MDTIIFKIYLQKEFGGFAAVSNFIGKMAVGLELQIEELRGITSCLVKRELSLVDAAKIACDESSTFLAIKRPENIISGSKDYHIIYCICADEHSVDDVVEWQYYVLLKKYYKELNICVVLKSSEIAAFFKTSHYLLEISRTDRYFYDSFFYAEGEKLSRLQKGKVEKTKDFVSLLYINDELLQLLKKPLKKVIGEKVIGDTITKKVVNIGELEYLPYLKGCLELMGRFGNYIGTNSKEAIIKQLSEGRLLTFILFVYSCYDCLKYKCTNKRKLNLSVVERFYQQVDECASGCLQLIENVVMHAESKTGVLSIRFHSRRTQYLSERYAGNIQNCPYLEVLITDYSGGVYSKNIAENFKDNIVRPDIKEQFSSLYPLDFIETGVKDEEHRKRTEKAFENYYSYSENIGKHYGLKIFQNILRRNQGVFSFYSHSSCLCREGESWNLNENLLKDNGAQCIPGTSFSVLFPLMDREESLDKEHVGIEEVHITQDKWKEYIKEYECLDREIVQPRDYPLVQSEKEKEIQRLVKELYSGKSGKRKSVIYVSAESYNPDYAEYFCKAILLAGYNVDAPDFVLYQCSNAFMKLFLQTMTFYFEMGTLNYVFQKNQFCIALYTAEDFKELLLFPHSIEQSLIANRLSGFSGNEIFENKWILQSDSENYTMEKCDLSIPPYEVMHNVKIKGKEQTIFEAYVLKVLDTNIQNMEFGCKIVDTHMRLGSTIHIDSFYEAELLYSNRLFVSRFAYLLAVEIGKNNDFLESAEITLYSYALYSELLVVNLISILEELYPEKSIDYAILERDAEHRGFKHIDRIRYSNSFENATERGKYFADRRIICIVPINSTLKTHEKLIDMFCKENANYSTNNIIMNFAVILVGSQKANKYWTIDEENRTFSSVNLKINPLPRYFVTVKVSYQEASECKMCFPENSLNEKPLIEVNAASTIPNQSFGLYKAAIEEKKFSWEEIKKEEESLKDLKSSLIYSHVNRGENHFSMYFRTDRFFVDNKDKIVEWLKQIRNKINVNFREQHILVCPSHFSNAGFLEYVNKIIFSDAALIIRVDVDKEYRCNMEAKYSSLHQFMRLLSVRTEQKSVVRVYYVDDSIISGRTFQRTKSLISSVLGIYIDEYPNLDIKLFDKIFILLDRNSSQTRMQYLEHVNVDNMLADRQKDRFWAFRTLRISSIRNHGDSCVICQLAKKDRILRQMSATALMAEHWKAEEKSHKVRSLSESQIEFDSGTVGEIKKIKQERAFRRMVCMHIAGIALGDQYHGNHKEKALEAVLALLLEDYNGRKEINQREAFEYLLSYFKVISRPFVAFSKAVREAVFDVILVCLEFLMNSDVESLWNTLASDKVYLKENKVLFIRVYNEIIKTLVDASQKRDMVLVLMKQCMELRSNYFIRPENIRKLMKFAEEYSDNEKNIIYFQFLCLVKCLVGVNSDTSKSAWFSIQLSKEEVLEDYLKLSKSKYSLLYLENTRAYFDGIERLYEGEWEENEDYFDLELNKYQYRDFRLIVQNYGWLNEKGGLNEIGKNSIVAAVKLLKVIKNFQRQDPKNGGKEDIRTVCKSVVDLIYNMVQAENVYLIQELPMECNAWEDDVKSSFNKLLYTEREKEKSFKLENKKEYMIIAGKNEDPMKSDYFSIEKHQVIKKFHQDSFARKCGFCIDEKNHCLLWEIGHGNHHPILLYVEFQNEKYDKYLMWSRNIMANNYYFYEYLFSGRIRENLYELMLAEKERLLYNIDKIESHTEVDIKNKQYSDVQVMEAGKEALYRSYALTLLKDLKVSDVYRPSLHRKFYCRDLKIATYTWDRTAIEFDKKSTCFYVVGTNYYDYIKVVVHTDEVKIEGDSSLRANDELIGFKILDGESTPFLLVLALIMNAAVEGRAKVVQSETNPMSAIVDVYLSCTSEGNLRILNISAGEPKNLEKIKMEMDYPPGKDSGISLWSMSRYIKSLISTIAKNCIEAYKKGKANVQECDRLAVLSELKEILEDLFSERFLIDLGYKEVEGEKMFSVEIPILAKKYESHSCYFI